MVRVVKAIDNQGMGTAINEQQAVSRADEKVMLEKGQSHRAKPKRERDGRVPKRRRRELEARVCLARLQNLHRSLLELCLVPGLCLLAVRFTESVVDSEVHPRRRNDCSECRAHSLEQREETLAPNGRRHAVQDASVLPRS